MGLFELDGLQQKLQDSRRQLQKNRVALESAEDERRQAMAQAQRIDAELSTAKLRQRHFVRSWLLYNSSASG